MPPRIAIIAAGVDASGLLVSPGPTAPAARLARLTAALADAGHEVWVYPRLDRADLPPRFGLPAGAQVAPMATTVVHGLAPSEVAERARADGLWLANRWTDPAERPQVAHPLCWWSGALAAPAAMDSDIALVQSFGDTGPVDPAGRASWRRALGAAADQIIASSHAEIAGLVRDGLPRQMITLVRDGVDTVSAVPPEPAARPGGPRLLIAGEPSVAAGHADLLAALPWAPTVECVALARPADDWFSRAAADAGLADRIVRPENVDLAEWLGKADLVVCPPRTSDAESVAVALEAMACGAAVVATAVGALAETVVDGLTGALTPPANGRRLGSAIRLLLADPVLRMAYGTAGLDRARHCYSWQRCAGQLSGVYARVSRRSTVTV
ncbi:glycosyltransferase [Pilimelia columellifera]|uniref:Glycosyltransferase family 1 protein n=1 Tax=Pilimelia columellifera subsp. columellifera TaxID=706583 RepID=A0ABP6B076_9ACTN